jgi:phage-related minor tail protein
LAVPGILPGISGGLASGGTAMGGKTYLVGERGPELFTPGRTGSVAPNNALGGSNIVVNVDATGTQVQGDQPNANKLGEALGAAVRAELLRQKRPGGLLA